MTKNDQPASARRGNCLGLHPRRAPAGGKGRPAAKRSVRWRKKKPKFESQNHAAKLLPESEAKAQIKSEVRELQVHDQVTIAPGRKMPVSKLS